MGMVWDGIGELLSYIIIIMNFYVATAPLLYFLFTKAKQSKACLFSLLLILNLKKQVDMRSDLMGDDANGNERR